MAIAALGSASDIAASDDYDYPWKYGNEFGIHRLVGMKETFKPGERIRLQIVCCPFETAMPPDPRNGFNVQASVDRLDLNRSVCGANGAWREDLQ